MKTNGLPVAISRQSAVMTPTVPEGGLSLVLAAVAPDISRTLCFSAEGSSIATSADCKIHPSSGRGPGDFGDCGAGGGAVRRRQLSDLA